MAGVVYRPQGQGESSGSVGNLPPPVPPPAAPVNVYEALPAYAFTGKGPDGLAGKLVKFSIIYGAGAAAFPSLKGSGVPDESVKFAMLADGYGNYYTIAMTGYDWSKLVDGDGTPQNTTAFYGAARAAYKFVANAIRAANGWELIDVDDNDFPHNDTASFTYNDESDPNNVTTEWKNGTDLIYPSKDFPRNLYPELDAVPRTVVWWAGGGEIRMVPFVLNELRDDKGNLQWAGRVFVVLDRVTRTGYIRQSCYPVATANSLGSTLSGGASLGASIGSAIFPIVGTLVGALIGAIAGLFTGLVLNAQGLSDAIHKLATQEPVVAEKVVQSDAGVAPGAHPGVDGPGGGGKDSNVLLLLGVGLGLALLL